MDAPPDRPAARRRPLAGAVKVLLVLALILVALAAGTALRLAQGGIALPDWTVARVEERLNRRLAPAEIDLGRVALFLDHADGALRLRLSGAGLSRGGRALVALPEARLRLDAPAMLRGRVRPRSIAVDGLALEATRDADGRFSLAFGAGGGALPRDAAGLLRALDAALAQPLLSRLRDVRVSGVDIRLADAVTGLEQRVKDGTARLSRTETGVDLSLAMRLPVRGGAAGLTAGVTRDAAGARARVAVADLPISRLAELMPGVPALSLARGTIGLTAAAGIGETGAPGPITGRLDLRDGRLTDRPRMRLDRAGLGFEWVPGAPRIALTGISASSDDLSVEAEGQVLLEGGVTGPLVVQLRLGETVLDPDGLFERRVAFDEGVIEARLAQSPLALRIGQAAVSGPSGTARLSGRIDFRETGLDGGLRLAIPRMRVGDVAALWPPDLQPAARRWFTGNLVEGEARGATAALRLRPGGPPRLVANLDFTDATFRYIRHMPPAEGASGTVQMDSARVVVRLDRGVVPGLGPGEERSPETGLIDIAGSRVILPDLTERPPRAEVALVADGAVGDVLALLDNEPIRLLDKIGRDRTLARGQAAAEVSVELPLRPGNAPADILWRAEARLRDVASDSLVSGRPLRADRLSLTADPDAVEIAGDMTFDGIPFSGSWRQALPPPATEPPDPEAPAAPRPLPEPGQVRGTARITPEGVARFGLDPDLFELSGATGARIAVDLPAGAPPRLSARSDLLGLAAGLSVIGFAKPAGRAAMLEVEAVLDTVPEITSLTLDAPGLDVSGRVALNGDGTLGRAELPSVDAGWFAGSVTLTGRGAGRAPAVSVRGGRADLGEAPLGEGGGSGGEPVPLDIALERLQITDEIALTDLRARLSGPAGSFTGRINGGPPIEGVTVPQAAGVLVQARGADAGGVLRAAGLFEDARGGDILLTLRPTKASGQYDGQLRIDEVRVRNAPALASLLQTLSVVGILEQLSGEGLFFSSVESDFTLRPSDVVVRRASAVGPSMSITADGVVDLRTDRLDMQGVVSPIYLVNGLFGSLFGRRDEGLFGFTYRLTGPVADPDVSVNPLSILTPGAFRDIFRRPPPS